MMSTTYLEYEVALLLAKYGKNAVLNALASKMQLSLEELEALLKETPSKKASTGSKKNPAGGESIEQIIQEYPSKAHFIRTLHGRFANRTFLPELRDVRRFFEQRAQTLGSIKSRADSLPKLVRLLAELDPSELDALCQAEPNGAYSSLGLIADEILRPRD